MNSKRRAELQRKLSMGPVARPPADLLDRLKADIPKYLEPEAERRGFTPTLALSMRVAASLILLITTGVVTMKLLEPASQETSVRSVAHMERPIQAVTRNLAGSPATAPAAEEEVRLEITQVVPSSVPVAAPAAPATVAPQRAENDAVEAKKERAKTSVDSAGQETAIVAEAAAAPVQTRAATDFVTITAEAPTLAAPPPEPAFAPTPAPAPAERSTGLVSELFAYSIPLEQKKTVFGISIDPETFRSIKKDLESGTRPSPNRVDVDALVNYFAGAPAKAPRRAVNLEVEASPSPLKSEGQRAILRFTIDTARVEVAQRASTPPAAIDAKVEIDFNENAVASHHRVGSTSGITAEAILLHNVSVTGLYEVELKPKLKSTQRVATVRLKYRDLTTGREQTITRVVYGRDLAKEWVRASRRHRLASLGAVWSETLKGTAPDGDVARRAEELAAQNPGDTRARDLAEAASATTGGGL